MTSVKLSAPPLFFRILLWYTKITSKLQIVQDLQMGLSTVSQNLNALEQDGLICRDGYFESTGGRKAQVIQIVTDVKSQLESAF